MELSPCSSCGQEDAAALDQYAERVKAKAGSIEAWQGVAQNTLSVDSLPEQYKLVLQKQMDRMSHTWSLMLQAVLEVSLTDCPDQPTECPKRQRMDLLEDELRSIES